MKKTATKTKRNQAPNASQQRTLRLAAFVKQNLYDFVVHEGMKALEALLEGDREQLCGPAHRRGDPSDPLRWGKTEGRLVMGGRRVMVAKPRVRQQGKEVTLPAWEQFSDEDPLGKRTVEQMMVGVSTRNYDRSIEEVPEDYGPHGAAKSSVSRRFVALTREKLDAWLERDLSELRIAVVMIDGIEVGEHTVVVALGIDETGEKHPLGLWQGATENAALCSALLANLAERGLDPRAAYLFVIDGGKALRKAIRDVFGKRSLVQRCQEHKRRNVIGHLPKRMHGSVNRMLREAYRSTSRKVAKKRLQQLISHLEDDHPDAAESLREGLDETLTLKDLKLPAWLERTLSTTNPIENMNGGIRRVTRNVKRWRDGTMVRRWVAAAILEVARGFRRLRGHKGLPILLAALGRTAERTTRVDRRRKAA
jgi:transposase-like protein